MLTAAALDAAIADARSAFASAAKTAPPGTTREEIAGVAGAIYAAKTLDATADDAATAAGIAATALAAALAANDADAGAVAGVAQSILNGEMPPEVMEMIADMRRNA